MVSYHKGLVEGTIEPQFEEAPSRLRRITIREAVKIQSFPDDYVFCGNKGKIYEAGLILGDAKIISVSFAFM